MAATLYQCTNPDCEWEDESNEIIGDCPDCGSYVTRTWLEYESDYCHDPIENDFEWPDGYDL